ncbi:uncharacterized protein [Coffea arabica]|uniref:Uncharacterized protein n=1 Tax=Coffea arabica TaxID=13443 RepID=A0A6P6V656_COFAR|nr:uncharacterized protein LOC113717614 [Coffea arabica]
MGRSSNLTTKELLCLHCTERKRSRNSCFGPAIQVVRGQISFILQCAIPATIEICEESAGQVIPTNTSRVTLAFDAVFARLDAYNSQPNQTLVHRASAHDPPIGLRRRLCDHCHGNLAVRNMYLPPPRVVLVPHKDVMIILRLRRRHAGCLVTIHMLSSLLFCKRVMIWGQIAFKRRNDENIKTKAHSSTWGIGRFK